MKNVYIFRGISGSGKTTAARALMEAAFEDGNTVVACSADDFFVTLDGKYDFDPKKLGAAHAWCKGKFEGALAANADVVILDNTNTQKWEYEGYVHLAHASGYNVKIKVIGDPKDWKTAAARNVHSVPEAVVRKQSERFEV